MGIDVGVGVGAGPGIGVGVGVGLGAGVAVRDGSNVDDGVAVGSGWVQAVSSPTPANTMVSQRSRMGGIIAAARTSYRLFGGPGEPRRPD